MLQLPSKHEVNGLVRQTNLKYSECDVAKKTKIVTYNDFRNEGSISIKVEMEYFVQVQICTLKNHCSGYSEQRRIIKQKKEHVSGKLL